MTFRRVTSGAPWEAEVGYCRALRAGDRFCSRCGSPVEEAPGHEAQA